MRRKSCLLLLFGYFSCFALNFGKTYAHPAQKFHDLAMSRSDPNDRLFGQRMMGVVKHFIGDQISAGRYLEQVLAHYAATDREAHQQAALSWELRAAISRARLLRDPGRSADAIACLQPIYNRFTEGFGTADLTTAKQLLSELGDAGGR